MIKRQSRDLLAIAGLFAIGSALFLVAALASQSAEKPEWIGVCFFAGSIFFTSASALQLAAAAKLPHFRRPKDESEFTRPRSWMPHRVDWLAAAIQFPGTLLFNVNTFAAMNDALSSSQELARVWAPDAIGSALFLIAAILSFANSEHSWLSFRPRDLDWWIAFSNLAGSIAFGVSALAAFVRPETGNAISDHLANGATALGALGFLIGAILLVPQAERMRRREE